MARRQMELKVVSLDRVYGPVPMETLVRLAAEGRVAPEDLVRPSGTRQWHRVEDVPVLAAAMPLSATLVAEEEEGAEEFELDEAGGAWTPITKARRHEEATMEMAPMIDVTFLLLIFFMLTNTLANPVPIEVPEALHGRGVNMEGRQLILVEKDGSYFLPRILVRKQDAQQGVARDDTPEEASPLALDELVAGVRQNAEELGKAPMDVVINAHPDTRHVHVRSLVEQISALPEIGEITVGVGEKQ